MTGATTHSTRHAFKNLGDELGYLIPGTYVYCMYVVCMYLVPYPHLWIHFALNYYFVVQHTLRWIDTVTSPTHTHTLYISNVHTYYLTKWIIGIQKNDDFPVQNRYLLIHRTLFEYMQNHPSIDRSGESCLIFLVDLRGTSNLPAIVPYLETRNPCNRTALVQTLLFSLLSFLFPPSSMDQ